ncbi:hypothetical protein KCP69_10030 [Salmonella enterica subsp. enterica]|nr:hypothetical protein KCP69_10030 [Salmonella enterica subsp. enterica]
MLSTTTTGTPYRHRKSRTQLFIGCVFGGNEAMSPPAILTLLPARWR